MRFFLFAIVLGLTACAYAELDALPDKAASYPLPYYAEFCALAEIHQRPGFPVEVKTVGPGGHSTLYLNGACRDTDAHYPVLKLCAPGDSEEGVGLSVNAHFRNAQWVATPGRDFFYRGDLPQGARLTRDIYAATQDRAEALGIYDGVIFTEAAMADKPAGIGDRDYMYAVSVGTDYATDYARKRYCARVPLSQTQMQKIVAYLNDLNRPYRTGEKTFTWNLFENNCTHMVHNALAAAQVWAAWSTDRFVLFSLFDFPVPANEFVNLMQRTNDLDLSDLEGLYADKDARADLMENDSLPTQPLALADAATVIPDNDVYETRSDLIFYDIPYGPYQTAFRDIFSAPRYVSPRANLAYFLWLYGKIEAEKKPLAAYAEARGDDRENFTTFYHRYYDYIDRMRSETERKLNASAAEQSP
jgi:hypothetical protein